MLINGGIYLIKCYLKAKTTEFVDEHVEGLRYAGYWHIVALDDSFISFCSTHYVVALDSKNLL